MKDDDEHEFLTVKQASTLLGVKPATLYAYVSRGILQSFRQGVGRQRLYRRADIEALLQIRVDGTDAAPPDAPQQQIAETAAPYNAVPPEEDGILRDVCLPNAETWAGDH